MPENNDADFSFAVMAQIINKDSADSLGNFNNRISSIIEKHYDLTLPEEFTPDADLGNEISRLVAEFEGYMHNLQLRKACESLRKMWTLGHEYVHKNEPWKAVKSDKKIAADILKNALYLLNIYSCSLALIAPEIASVIRKQLRLDDKPFPSASIATDYSWLQKAITVESSGNTLIQKITPETVEQLTAQFSGNVTRNE